MVTETDASMLWIMHRADSDDCLPVLQYYIVITVNHQAY